MKKMLLATALALLITGCAQQTFTVQNKPAAVAQEAYIFLRFWNWAENCRLQPKFVAARRNVVKTETQQTFVNGYPVLLLWAFILRWKRVCIAHNNCAGYR